MVARRLPADEPFFREWNDRRPGERRDLRRALAVHRALAGDPPRVPVLTVLGSKGKGTAVTFASATLAACGLRVGTVSSPPLRTDRERIRVDGRSLDDGQYAALSARLDATLSRLPARTGGYLSPTGAYTVTGVAHLAPRCDVLVLEEGLGGLSDEVSLFAPDGVVLTEIFAEHLDVIGPTVEDAAADLAGVTVPGRTRFVLSLPQAPAVHAVLAGLAGPLLEVVEAVDAAGHPPHPDVRGPSRLNAALGTAAGLRLAALLGSRPPADLAGRLARVRLPGRLSAHRHPSSGRLWVVDGAISPAGVRAALDAASAGWGRPGVVLAAFPDVKDARGCWAALAGLPVVPVAAGTSYLRYEDDAAPAPHVPLAGAVSRLPGGEAPVLAVGTMSLVGEVLDHLDVPVDTWW